MHTEMMNNRNVRPRAELIRRTTEVDKAALLRALLHFCALAATFVAVPARASIFQGDTLDAVADGISWVVIVIGPIIAIAVFWLVHILPEKIAEKKHHPQAKAIQTLCLLSLVFGGLLWPIAWLWAYTKPVLHKMAYGTDVHDHDEDAYAARVAASGEDTELHRSHVMKVVDHEHELPVESGTNRERA